MLKEKTLDRLENLKYVLIAAVVVLFFVVAAIVLFYNCSLNIKQQKAIDGGVTATAKIVKVDAHVSSSSMFPKSTTTYYLVYEYIDDKGVKYSGNVLNDPYKTYESAAKHIGEEITIYIDGKGNSIPKGEKTNYVACLVFGILMCILGTAAAAYSCYLIIPLYRKNKTVRTNIVIDESDYEVETQDSQTK